MGRKEKGREGKEGEKRLLGPQTKFLDLPLIVSAQPLSHRKALPFLNYSLLSAHRLYDEPRKTNLETSHASV
jgi:hypothetical protein